MPLTPQVKDDLFVLGMEDNYPSPELVHDIETVEDLGWWNEWYQKNGFADQVNDDYGELNWMAKALGFRVTSDPEVFPG
jgi:hypothetical protein